MRTIDLGALGVAFSDLTISRIGSGLIVYADLDGDGLDSQDFGLQLKGVTSLGESDFIFA